MIKKVSTTLMLGMAIMLASCSQDDVLQDTVNNPDGLKTMTLSVDIPSSGMQTRAVAEDDDIVRRCFVQVLDKDGGSTLGEASEVKAMEKNADGTFRTTVFLKADEEYTFLFWADNANPDSENAPVPNDLKKVHYINNGNLLAWAGKVEKQAWSAEGVSCTLSHAVARITVQSTTDVTLGKDKRLTLTIPTTYTAYNVLTGEPTGESESFVYSTPVPPEEIVMGANNTICFYYVLVKDGNQDLKLQYNNQPEVTVTNVPLKPNCHTILKGDVAHLGLEEFTLTATIDADWTEGENIEFTPRDLTKGSITITDDGSYVITSNGTQTANTITINGNATVKLVNVNINTQQNCGININGGNPVIVVSGTDNTVESTVNSGIGLSNGAGVTIKGETGKASDKLVAKGANGGAGIGTARKENCGDITIDNVEIDATATSMEYPKTCAAGIGTVGGGICGDITIRNAIINATGGDFSPAIGLGTDYINLQKEMGRIVINDSDITATGGSNASVIGFPYSSVAIKYIYKTGAILITTDKTLDEFLSKLTFGETNGSGFSSRYKVGKGFSNPRDWVPDFYDVTGDGPWEGVTITASDGIHTNKNGLGVGN